MRKPSLGIALLASLAIVGSCSGPVVGSATITGRLVAGPVCPVETNPPDPACEPTPVADAEIVVTDSDGTEHRTDSGADGTFDLTVPPGDLTVVFSTVEGSLGTPEPITVTVTDQETTDLGEIVYETGIR